MAGASSSAAESNSLQPSVPASVVVRDMSSLAPGRDGGSPSSLITVASTTSSPLASRRASSVSTSGMGGRPAQNASQDLDRVLDLVVGGCRAGGETEAAQRLV